MLETSDILRFSLKNEGPEILGAQGMTCSGHGQPRARGLKAGLSDPEWPLSLWNYSAKGTAGSLNGSVELDSSHPPHSAFHVCAAGIWIALCWTTSSSSSVWECMHACVLR